MTRIKLLADENIASPMVEALRNAGWDVAYIAEQAPGVVDEDILKIAKDEQRILLTEDKDFGELVVRMRKEVAGIILVRLATGPWERRWQRLQSVLENRAQEFSGKYVVIEQDRIRLRPMS